MSKASERLIALRFKYDKTFREKLVAAEEAKVKRLVRRHTKRGDEAAVAAIEAAMTLPDEVLVPPKAAVIDVPKRKKDGWEGGRTLGATINGRPTTDFDRLRYFNPEAYAALMRDVTNHICPLCGGKLTKDGYCKKDDLTVKPREEQRVGEQFTTIEEQNRQAKDGTRITSYRWECPDCGWRVSAATENALMDEMAGHACAIKEVN